jgi:hypothetical protein
MGWGEKKKEEDLSVKTEIPTAKRQVAFNMMLYNSLYDKV